MPKAYFERAIADVLAAKSVMQQSLFDEQSTYDPAWRRPLLAAMILAGSAFVTALIALAVVLWR